MQQPTFKLGHRPELDGIRGLSILLVFIHHVYSPLMPGGFLGVDVFFVLSGFLITSLLLTEWDRTGSISIKDFYIRRALRLLPAITVLSIVLAAGALFLNERDAEKTYRGIWLALSYVSNWLYAFKLYSAENPLGVTWSLAIEEQFYLFWPLVLRFLLQSKWLSRRGTVLLVIGLLFLIIGHRSWLHSLGVPVERLYYGSDTRADALLIGCLIGFMFCWNFVPKTRAFKILVKAFTVVSVGFLAYMTLTATWEDLLLYRSLILSMISVAAGMVLIGVLVLQSRPIKMVLQFAPLVWFGRISYGLYLWHWPILWIIYQQKHLPPSNLQLFLVMVLSLVLPTLSYYFVEERFLRLKGRFNAAAVKPTLIRENL